MKKSDGKAGFLQRNSNFVIIFRRGRVTIVYINILENLQKTLPVRIIQDNQGRYDTGNPAAEGQDKDNQYGAATLVDNCQRREDDGEDYSEYRHVQCV